MFKWSSTLPGVARGQEVAFGPFSMLNRQGICLTPSTSARNVDMSSPRNRNSSATSPAAVP